MSTDKIRTEEEIDEPELPDYGEYDEGEEDVGGVVEEMYEDEYENEVDPNDPNIVAIPGEKSPGLVWGDLNPNDILRQDQISLEDDEVDDQLDAYIGANRRNGVYVEGGNKFKFRANLEDYLVKQNYQGSGKNEIGPDGGEEDGELEDQAELSRRQYDKFQARLSSLMIGLFGFLKGVLAGMCFLFLLMIYIPFDTFSETTFLAMYKPMASTFSKIFILMTTICFVCSIFVINAKCWSPGTSKFQKLNMMMEGSVYFVIICCTFLCGTAEDYFSSHSLTSTSELTGYFYLWQIMNGIRAALAVLTYLLGTICNL